MARLILIAVVALLVPAQGALAVAAGQCMALEHHEMPAGGHDAPAHDGHDMPDHGDAPAKSAHCGPCAACCASTAMAAGVPLVIPAFAAEHAPSYQLLLQPGIAPDSHFRPPLAL